MKFPDIDLTNLSKEELIALVKNSREENIKELKSIKFFSKQELFENVMTSLESKYGNVPGDLIIDALVKTGRFSLAKARKFLSDASRNCDVVEAKSGCFRRTSTGI